MMWLDILLKYVFKNFKDGSDHEKKKNIIWVNIQSILSVCLFLHFITCLNKNIKILKILPTILFIIILHIKKSERS